MKNVKTQKTGAVAAMGLDALIVIMKALITLWRKRQMPDCKTCGMPAKIIKVNRALTTAQRKLQDEVRELRSKYATVSKQLTKAEKANRSSKETISKLRFDRKQARAETVEAWVRIRHQEKDLRHHARQREKLAEQNAILVAKLSRIQATLKDRFNG